MSEFFSFPKPGGKNEKSKAVQNIEEVLSAGVEALLGTGDTASGAWSKKNNTVNYHEISPTDVQVATGPRNNDENGGGKTKNNGKIENKRFWMEDDMCKECYRCERHFSLVRRRHHCRVCGRIFCGSCSSYTVNGEPYGYTGAVRACANCFEIVKKEALEREMTSRKNAPKTMTSFKYSTSEELDMSQSPEKIKIKTTKHLQPKPAFSQATLSASSNFPSNNAKGVAGNYNDANENMGRQKRTGSTPDFKNRAPRLRKQGLSFEEFVGTRRKSSASLLSLLRDEKLKQEKETNTNNQHESETSSKAGVGSLNADHQKTFAIETEKVLKAYCERSLTVGTENQDSNSQGSNLVEAWSDRLVQLSELACLHVRPKIGLLPHSSNSDLQDIRKYIIPVIIAGGKKENSCIVNGIIFKKNIANRQMKSDVENPRIMIIENSIEFHRDESRFASLETLYEQEKQYLQLVVDKIVNVGVDVLLVGKSVSRHGQELLVAAGISLVLNVERKTLLRVSRLTGAGILPSTDHITKTNVHTGTCASFKVKSFDAEDKDKLNGQYITYIFLEGCSPKLGCTICLRGEKESTLLKLKKVLNKLVLRRYWMTYENKLLQDIGASVFCERNDDGSAYRDSCVELLGKPEMTFTRIYINGVLQSLFPEDKTFRFSSETFDIVLGRFILNICGALRSPQMSFSSTHNVIPLTNKDQYQVQQPLSDVDALETDVGQEPNFTDPVSSLKAKRIESINGEKHDEKEPGLNVGMTKVLTKKSLNVQFSSLVYMHGFGKVTIKFEKLYSTNDPFLSKLKQQLLNIRRQIVSQRIMNMQNEKCERFRSLAIDEENDTGNGGLLERSPPVTGNFLLVGGTCKVCGTCLTTRPVSRESAQVSLGRFLLNFMYQKHVKVAGKNHNQEVCSHSLFQNYVIFFEHYGILTTFEFEEALPYMFRIPNPVLTSSSAWSRIYTGNLAQEIDQALEEMMELLISRAENIYSTLTSIQPPTGDSGPSPSPDILVSSTKMSMAKEIIESAELKLAELRENLKNAAEKGIFAVNAIKREAVFSVIKWNESLQEIHTNATIHRPTESAAHKSLPSFWTRLRSMESASSYHSQDSTQSNITSSPGTRADDTAAMHDELPLEPLEATKLPPIMREGHPLLSKKDDKLVIFPFENEPTSLIAHALCSKTYNDQINHLLGHYCKPLDVDGDGQGNEKINGESDRFTVANLLSLNLPRFESHVETCFVEESDFHSNPSTSIPTTFSLDQTAKVKRLERKFHNSTDKETPCFRFEVKVHHAIHFHALRILCGIGGARGVENGASELFIESLSRCFDWNPSGGKTKANFYQTRDGRYVVKTITAEELEMFHALSGRYFAHMKQILCNSKKSALLKILGVYTVSTTKRKENTSDDRGMLSLSESAADSPLKMTSGKSDGNESVGSPLLQNHFASEWVTTKQNILVIEKLDMGAMSGGISECHLNEEYQLFDLKGNLRNRYVNNPKVGSVLLDVNLFELMEGVPMNVSQQEKAALMEALKFDTHMLEQAGIVDYSLLVGLPKRNKNNKADKAPKTIILGIVDYLQLYNYRKLIESSVKRATMLAGKLEPTVVDPTSYRNRFIDSMDRFFVVNETPIL